MRHLSGLQARRKGTKGFTLLELVIVIVILAIIAGLAVPRYIRVVNRSRGSEALSMLNHIRESAERYYARNGAVYTGMTPAAGTNFAAATPSNLDFDPTDIGGAANFTYQFTAIAAASYTLRATSNAVAADTITVTNAGVVTGAGAFVGI